MKQHPKKPESYKLLYKGLFENHSHEYIIKLISQGLKTIAQNATELLDEAEILLNSDKQARAGFLIATADEEISKTYILLDMCRLEFDKHESLLRKLCKAFYCHVTKYAYNQVVRTSSFGIYWDMARVKDIFENNLVTWYEGDFESGEPDLPHSTAFTRDFNLYVDYIESDGAWWLPSRGSTITLAGEYKEAREALGILIHTRECGLYEPEILTILNDRFHKHIIKADTDTNLINGIYNKIISQLKTEFGIDPERFLRSALRMWPLYNLL